MGTVRYVEATRADTEHISKFLGISDHQILEREYFSYLADQSVFFMAMDGENIVGTQAFIPYEMNVNGRVLLTGRSERTLVSPSYRGQDVFVNLMDHCVRRASEKGHMFFWGAATAATKAFKRVGYLQITRHREYLIAAVSGKQILSKVFSGERAGLLRPAHIIKTLRTRDRMQALYYAQLAVSPVSIIARLPASALGALGRAKGLELVRVPKSEADIDDLYVRLRGQSKLMHLKHSAAFDKWMLHDARWFFAYCRGELIAYICLDLSDAVTAKLVDFAAAEKRAFYALLEETRNVAQQEGRAFIYVVCNPNNFQQKALYPAFYAAGFVPSWRGGNSVVRAGTYNDMNMLAEKETWYMTDLWILM